MNGLNNNALSLFAVVHCSQSQKLYIKDSIDAGQSLFEALRKTRNMNAGVLYLNGKALNTSCEFVAYQAREYRHLIGLFTISISANKSEHHVKCTH